MTSRSPAAGIFARFRGVVGRLRREPSGREYWDRRARTLGARAVLDIRHAAQEVEEVTERQKGILFPLLRDRLTPRDRSLLDFGCGAGRFTPDLATLIGGRALGVDPTRCLLELAPAAPGVEYRWIRDVVIPAHDRAVDVVWICLVLGGILPQRELQTTADEIDRVLRPGGLLFLVENTSSKPDLNHWRYRSASDYVRLFSFAPLSPVSEYSDLGETMSVLAGRKPSQAIG